MGALPRDTLVLLLFLLGAAIFLYWDAPSVPVMLWDESRNIVNALEMRASGWSLVTSYEFKQDLWNTKPPLLIWLMTGSAALFGTSEWAFRIPVMLASLGTLVLTFAFARRYNRSRGIGLFACAILLLSPGFFGTHGARTADFDALLIFFTTGYLFLILGIVSRTRGGHRTPLLAGLAIAGAVLTKGVAGLIPGAGVLTYLLVTRRLGRTLRQPATWLMALVALVPVALFYAGRELAAPGYLDAVLHNELSGRYGSSLIGRTEPWYFYLYDMLRGWFVAAPLLVLGPLGWAKLPWRSRQLVIFCLCIAGTLLFILSLGSTKLPHYALPAYPPLAIATALLLRGAWDRMRARMQERRQRLLLGTVAALLVLLPTARSIYWRIGSLPASETSAKLRYGELFDSLARQGHRDVSVIEPGFRLIGRPDYAPLFRAHQLMWAERGFRAERRNSGPLLASCDQATVAKLGLQGRDIANVPGCIAIISAPAGRPVEAAL